MEEVCFSLYSRRYVLDLIYLSKDASGFSYQLGISYWIDT